MTPAPLMRFLPALLTALLIASCASLQAQTTLFDETSIQDIHIYFGFADWDYRLDTAKAGAEGYLAADSVVINGVSIPGAGVKYKGSSSYDSTRLKNPLHLKLDFTDNNADYEGVEDLKLGNGFSDPSLVREVLGYHILRNYMHAPRCNFARVYINGSYRGVYSNAEDIDNPFLLDHFYSDVGVFVKANPLVVFNGHLPTLVYLGQDSTLYYDRYEIKSDYGWQQLIDLCDTLTNEPAALENILDADRALWMLAFNNVAVNLDSYTGAFAQNYYLYRDPSYRFSPIVWDLNMCFGAFTNTGSANLNLASMQTMDPALQSANAARPLIQQLLANDRWHKMYTAHQRTLNGENFSTQAYLAFAQQLQALIDSSVQASATEFYTYAQFQQGLTTSAGSVPGVNELMGARGDFLDTTASFQLVPPTLGAALFIPSLPALGSTFTLLVTAGNADSVFVGWRNHKSKRFSREPMFDDGAHNDGAAGDGQFGITLVASSLTMQYFFYAENSDAGIFSPERAEYEFFELRPFSSAAAAGEVVLNEVLPDNEAGILNEEGKHRDWIELYNNTAGPLALTGWYLSDDFAQPMKWALPDDAFVPAEGHLLLWADGNNATWIEAHTNFSFNNSGDSLYLFHPTYGVTDSLHLSAAGNDIVRARCPDGTGNFQLSVVNTPRSENLCSLISVEDPKPQSTFTLWPNPAIAEVHFDFSALLHPADWLSLRTAEGVEVRRLACEASLTLPVQDLPAGLYLVEVYAGGSLLATRRLAVCR